MPRKHNIEDIESGDYIVDPMDGEIRKVSHIEGTTIHMTDGGVISIDESFDLLLPSEVEG